MLKRNCVGVKATLLGPMAWHSLSVPGGTASLKDALGDRAVCYAIASALGWMRAGGALPTAEQTLQDLREMPFRCSMLMAEEAKLLPPRARKLNADAEGPVHKSLQGVMDSGNVKAFHSIQEIAPGSVYSGALFGEDPFALAGASRLVLTMGLNRRGMVLLEPMEEPETVRLNPHTATVFGRSLPGEVYWTRTMRATPEMGVEAALGEVSQWV